MHIHFIHILSVWPGMVCLICLLQGAGGSDHRKVRFHHREKLYAVKNDAAGAVTIQHIEFIISRAILPSQTIQS